jgi:hypothetical protein
MRSGQQRVQLSQGPLASGGAPSTRVRDPARAACAQHKQATTMQYNTLYTIHMGQRPDLAERVRISPTLRFGARHDSVPGMAR